MAAIMRGEYQPGDAVREQELADQFQVSRGPIREAPRILDKAGVVTITPQRGARVRQLSVEEVDHLYEIRCALVRLVPRHLLSMSDAQIAEFETLVDRLDDAAPKKDGWRTYADTVFQLNNLLFDWCENPQLGEMLRSIGRQTMRYTPLGLRDETRRLASAKGWRRFVRALRRRNAEQAGDALVDLIAASRKAVLEALMPGARRTP